MSSNNLPPVTPFPPNPDYSEFLHLSEWNKLLKGYPYRTFHRDFLPQRTKCRTLLQQFNRSSFDDEKTRRALLNDLFDPSCRANKSMHVEPSLRCDLGCNVKVGENFYAQFDCVLLDSAQIVFGNDCFVGPGVHVYSATHPLNAGYRRLTDMPNYFELTAPVTIGNNCWLGGAAVVKPGITLGNNVIVAAGAVVTKSFPDNVVIAGNPARIIRHMPEPSAGAQPFWKNMDGIMNGLEG